jgi:hypothetical protein
MVAVRNEAIPVEEQMMNKPINEKDASMFELIEGQAWADCYINCSDEFTKKYRVEARQVGNTWVTMMAGLDWSFFNRVIGLGMKEPSSEVELDEKIRFFEKAGCKNYMVQLSPQARPIELPDWLIRRGFKKGGNWVKTIRGRQEAVERPSRIRVEEIGDERANLFAEVALNAFEMPMEVAPFAAGSVGKPGWHHYLGYDADHAVAAGAMYINEKFAWLGYGSTLETHRGLGGQGAMFTRRIKDGLKMGCEWFVTETGEDTPEAPNPSYRNMLKAGFQPVYLRPNYVH